MSRCACVPFPLPLLLCLGEDWCSTAYGCIGHAACTTTLPTSLMTGAWTACSGWGPVMLCTTTLLCWLHQHVRMTCLVAQKYRSQQHMVQVYDLDTFKVTHASKYPGPVTSLGISPDCGLLAVGQADGQLSIRKHSEPKLVPVEAGKLCCTSWPPQGAASQRVMLSACCLPHW